MGRCCAWRCPRSCVERVARHYAHPHHPTVVLLHRGRCRRRRFHRPHDLEHSQPTERPGPRPSLTKRCRVEYVRQAAWTLIVLVLVTVASGCGSKQQPQRRAATNQAPLSRPLACLKDAGLINFQRRGKNLWIADNEAPFFGVTIDRFPTSAAATKFVAGQKSVRNWVAQAGRFAVGGPGKADVPEDQGDVAAVASCLRR
jgi:hypothetical protein